MVIVGCEGARLAQVSGGYPGVGSHTKGRVAGGGIWAWQDVAGGLVFCLGKPSCLRVMRTGAAVHPCI